MISHSPLRSLDSPAFRRQVRSVLASLLLPAAVVLASPPGAAPAGARAAAGRRAALHMEVRVGLGQEDGEQRPKYKVGYWTPVHITLEAGQAPFRGKLELTTKDGDGVRTVFVADSQKSLFVPAGGAASLWRYVKFGRARGRRLSDRNLLTVTLRPDEGSPVVRSLQLAPALLSTQAWIVTAGPSIDGEGPSIGVELIRRGASAAFATSRIANGSDLPDRWYGYEGVDVLVLTTSRLGPLEELTGDQFVALEDWVRMGGRLVFCVGVRGPEMLAEDSRFQRFAPGRFDRVVQQPRGSVAGLESYAGAKEPLVSAGGDAAGLKLTVLSEVRGRIEAFEAVYGVGERPVIAQCPFGFGQVVFVAFDPDQPPLSEWRDRPRLVAQILRGALEDEGERADVDRRGRVTHLGYEDIAGQLRSAMDQFQEVRLVAFSWVAGLIILYIALIGPVDYFFLRKVVGRMHWSWCTFPLVAVAFGLLAVLLVQGLKTNRLRINQVDLVDVDVATSLVRGATWVHLYSPRADAYDLALVPTSFLDREAAARVLFSWQGLPGRGLGGLNTTASAPFDTSYSMIAEVIVGDDARPAVRGLPIQASSTKSLAGRWRLKGSLRWDGQLTAGPTGLLRGEFSNPLPVELSDCMLLYGNWAHDVKGTLGPGETARVDDQPLNLQWRLSRRRLVEMSDVGTPWDQSSFEVPRILELMMFHKAAGGRAYTGLSHRYQGYIDLSDHLDTGRAVLVGRGRQRASKLLRDGDPLSDSYERDWTFYRVVFPVERTGGSTNQERRLLSD
jgi:hypothetical protein